MVVLDALHRIQAEKAPELGVRWNCKAGKCGSCSMEINGRPKLACMTRMNALPKDESIVACYMELKDDKSGEVLISTNYSFKEGDIFVQFLDMKNMLEN